VHKFGTGDAALGFLAMKLASLGRGWAIGRVASISTRLLRLAHARGWRSEKLSESSPQVSQQTEAALRETSEYQAASVPKVDANGLIELLGRRATIEGAAAEPDHFSPLLRARRVSVPEDWPYHISTSFREAESHTR
jgi:hypothetical protein